MVFEKLKSKSDVSDEAFDALYPRRIQRISGIHFTPVEVVKVAAAFLVNKPGTRVLDIGAGAGKFCLIGAACTTGFFTGVEQRLYLCQQAALLSSTHGLINTRFIHANILDVDFLEFDAVYLFNPFSENVFLNGAMDTEVLLDRSLYASYNQHTKTQLAKMPTGTRLVTYFSFGDEIPEGYKVQSKDFDGKLKLWEKME